MKEDTTGDDPVPIPLGYMWSIPFELCDLLTIVFKGHLLGFEIAVSSNKNQFSQLFFF